MIISPVITGFAMAAFALSYIIYKYLYTWVVRCQDMSRVARILIRSVLYLQIDQPPHSDTGGLFFPKAITHLFIGLYIQQIALCALFFLARNSSGNVSAIPQGALMVVLCCLTVSPGPALVPPRDCADLHRFYQLGFQIGIVHSYNGLKTPLPLSLAYLSYGMPREEGHIADVAEGEFDARPIEEERNRLEKLSHMIEDGAKRHSLPVPPGLNRRSSARTLPHPEDADDGASHGPKAAKDKNNKQAIEMNNMGDKVQEKAGQLDASTKEQHGTGDAAEQREWEQHMAALRASNQNGGEVPSPANATARGSNSNDDESYDGNEGVVESSGRNKTEFAQDAFSHPASKEPQRTVWLPEDDLGLAAAEVSDNSAIGILSTTTDAYLNRKVSLLVGTSSTLEHVC